MGVFSLFLKARFNRFLLLTGFILLSGCSSQININEPLTAKTKIDQQQGVVVVRVINASSYPLPFNHLTIAPKNLNESKNVKFERLVSLKTHTTDSNIFSSAIKAGSYSLSSVSSFHRNGDYFYSRGAGAEIKFGTFEVEQGKITDLGTIIYYPKPQDDKYINTLTRLEGTQSVEVLNKFFPFYNYDMNQVLTWNEDELDEERYSTYVSIAQNPVTFNHKYAAPDGSMYFIGKLGVIIKRSAEGEWEIDAVDSNVDLNTIKQSQNGDLIVAGNEGVVFFKKFGGEWQDISLTTTSNIKQIEITNNHAELMSFQTTTAEIYRANLTEDTPKWLKMASYTTFSGWKDGDGNTQQISVIGKKDKTTTKRKVREIFNIQTHKLLDQHVVSITYGSNYDLAAFGDGYSKDFTFDPETWEVKTEENSADIVKTIQAGHAKIAIEKASYWSLTGKPSMYTVDETGMQKNELSTVIKSCNEGYTLGKKICFKGKEHEKIKRESFNFVSIPWFLNEQEAFSIVSFRHYNFFAGPAKTEYKILKTNDGGNNWVKTDLELPNEYCMDIVSQVKDRILLSCDGVSGDFYESSDFGETWQHVRQHENF
ncbi:hypothetical protein RI845_14280 [Thalassotalea nanhaiensis]|uniref:Photosynthesis system II assembly factor Ycf48/Hcf136-like domain-containing protein n=1 Tax=Thalassotalea nanhaiensis TaxID=3065648 RepID=A0ABY9TG36_9GAMM|nr:hypothetical protein RI845_14280 [Colwelliaceae bacterium SQ345]